MLVYIFGIVKDFNEKTKPNIVFMSLSTLTDLTLSEFSASSPLVPTEHVNL